jgi:hypothetical protein
MEYRHNASRSMLITKSHYLVWPIDIVHNFSSQTKSLETSFLTVEIFLQNLR